MYQIVRKSTTHLTLDDDAAVWPLVLSLSLRDRLLKSIKTGINYSRFLEKFRFRLPILITYLLFRISYESVNLIWGDSLKGLLACLIGGSRSDETVNNSLVGVTTHYATRTKF